MDAELGGWQGEDEPAVTVVDLVPAEDIAEDVSNRFRLGGVEEGMGADDGHGALCQGTA